MTNNFEPRKESGGYRPRLSTEEWKARKKAEKDTVYRMIDDTAEDIVKDPAKFAGYLDTQSRMDRYSATNALLIYRQRPDATQLKDFNDWAAEKVSIRKGEKSISILEPVEYTKSDGTAGVSFNVKKMFDISQTNAAPNRAPAYNQDLRAVAAAMIDTAPVAVETLDELPYPGMGALYDNEQQKLYVRRNIGDSAALCQCLAQELSHAQLAAHGTQPYNRRDVGFQAVCIGYMLCSKYGIDTRNFAINRIPENWQQKEPKEIKSELTSMRTAMHEIHSRVSEQLYRKTLERAKEHER